jgi:hypothetical protein
MSSEDPWGGLLELMQKFGSQARTNQEIYKSGPEAMRAWMASGSHLPFDKWLGERPRTRKSGGI